MTRPGFDFSPTASWEEIAAIVGRIRECLPEAGRVARSCVQHLRSGNLPGAKSDLTLLFDLLLLSHLERNPLSYPYDLSVLLPQLAKCPIFRGLVPLELLEELHESLRNVLTPISVSFVWPERFDDWRSEFPTRNRVAGRRIRLHA